MRLLSGRPDYDGCCVAQEESETIIAGDHQRHEWQHLPLWNLPPYSRSRCTGINQNEIMKAMTTSRRNFMKLAAAAGGGFMLGFHWSDAKASTIALIDNPVEGDITFNSYLSIAPDGTITIFSPNPELGQNIKTSFPMIV